MVLFWASSKNGIFARKRENGTRSARPFGVNLVEQHRAGGAPTRRSDLRDQCGTCWAAPRVCRRGAGCATSVHHRRAQVPPPPSTKTHRQHKHHRQITAPKRTNTSATRATASSSTANARAPNYTKKKSRQDHARGQLSSF